MESPRILAIETSGRRGSIALGCGESLLDEVVFATDRERARDLLPSIDAAFRRQGWRPPDIEHCYLSNGPGSFTGLRVGVTFARHLALATDCKLCAISSMDVMAQNALELSSPPNVVAAFLDARKDQVFAAAYQLRGDYYERTHDVRMAAPAAFLAELGSSALVLGEGAKHAQAAIETAGGRIADESLWHARASVVYRMGWRAAVAGQFVTAPDLVPAYVRRPEAEEVWEKRQAQSDDGQ